MQILYSLNCLRSFFIVLLVTATALTAGCDNPVEDDNDDHAEVAGFILMLNGEEVVHGDEVPITDTLFIALDDTSVIEVEFVDEDGRHVHAEDLEGDFALDVESADESIAAIVGVQDWSFSLAGRAADTTSIAVGLLHLPGEHHDLTPRDVAVVVQ